MGSNHKLEQSLQYKDWGRVPCCNTAGPGPQLGPSGATKIHVRHRGHREIWRGTNEEC